MAPILRYLESVDYSAWDALVDASPQHSLFYYSWWLRGLDAQAKVLGYFDADTLVAGLPLHCERRFGINMYVRPKLTYHWGVVIEPLVGRTVEIASRETEILRSFAVNMAAMRCSIFVLSLDGTLQNWLPFYWQGFTPSLGVTYVLDNLNPLDRVFDGMQPSLRRQIRKARNLGIEVQLGVPDAAYALIEASFKRQGLKLPYSKRYFTSLYHCAKEHNAGDCFIAQDCHGKNHAAAFLVWDRKRAYYLAGGADPDLRSTGANCLLMWHLIEFAARKVNVFDFEGSHIENIERFFRAFGASQKSYPRLIRASPLVRAALAVWGRI